MAGFAVQGLTQAAGVTPAGFTPYNPYKPAKPVVPAPPAPPKPVQPRTQDPNTGNVGQWNPETGGYDPVSMGAQGDQRALALEQQRAQLRAQQFSSFMAKYGGAALPSAPAPIAPIAAPDTTAADALQFGRAKDKTAQSTQGLLKALQDRFAGRGLSGSSLEGNAEAHALASGASDLSNEATTEAVTNLARTDATNKTNYEGAITQRAQDQQAQVQRSQALMALWKMLDY